MKSVKTNNIITLVSIIFVLFVGYLMFSFPKEDRIVGDLRKLKGAATFFYADNLGFDNVEPEIGLLKEYISNISKYTKTPGEYLFVENNGKLLVGYNLMAGKATGDSKNLREKLKRLAKEELCNDTGESPYNGEDTVYMLVKKGGFKN